ncbi:hypothetical protein LB557_02010 [Mesorhizobium sp. BR115XR7A]|uniref:hypothetical protein n=1 Tax=Mesorhizobium sp. BR115XR7A TaxID=2876645 RepID=UPI001CCFF7D0|nr:hypothetical protein [Mesorhizobium sp. BR115XR7A]MBZ9904782.1 hypothetical protein [Mesorhizobium sp. BR115XR7A]MBZ9933035.1 hypothetical protein [Mesorhizobium sp. BR1-1-5]
MPTKRASARRIRAPKINRDQAAIDAIENAVASAAITGLVDALRAAAFSDAYIAASLLAGATSLIRVMPNREPFAALLAGMAQEVTHVG